MTDPSDAPAGEDSSGTNASSPAHSGHEHAYPVPDRRPALVILRDLFRPGAGQRAQGAPSDTRNTKQVVEGLDPRELRYSIVLTIVQLICTPIFFWYGRTHGDATVRGDASEILITGLISVALLALGTVLRRRALVGFAAFMTGFAWFTYQNVLLAFIFLFFGGWLITRVMRKQKQDRLAGVSPTTARRRPSPEAERRPPAASKRYTPPRRAVNRRSPQGRRS